MTFAELQEASRQLIARNPGLDAKVGTAADLERAYKAIVEASAAPADASLRAGIEKAAAAAASVGQKLNRGHR